MIANPSRRETLAASPVKLVRRRRRSRRRFLPHVWVFTLVNLGYCAPVLLAYLWEFKEGGVAETLAVSSFEMVRFGMVYLLAVSLFYLGALLVARIPLHRQSGNPMPSYRRWSAHAPGGLYIVTAALCTALIGSKLLLIPSGVYSVYAFDANLMGGGMWTASMFFSESLLMMLFAMLVAGHRVSSPWFYVPFLVLSTNLLHGTRIFDVSAVIGTLLFYVLYQGLRKRLLIRAAGGLVLVFVALYVAFATRVDYKYSDDATGLTVALSPVVYESVFSQMSLIRFLGLESTSLFGQPLTFLGDAVSFVLPRLINPDKDEGALIQSYADLSPLGAFSGHAAGLIYFGYSLFAVYFCLGGFCSWLQRRARGDPVIFTVYLYMTGNILFRLMRDGMIYPVKYFSNSVVILLIAVGLLHHFVPSLFASRRAGRRREQRSVDAGLSLERFAREPDLR